MPSKNDAAWEELFQRHRILDHVNADGVFQISAAAINEIREARLMTKFDHYIQLPTVFKQNDLTIQPNTRGTYLIGRFRSYLDLPTADDVEIEAVAFPREFETLNPQDLYSESAALLCAYNSGILEQLLNEPVALTVLGRMSTGRFNYFINESQTGRAIEVNVQNSQCEIDSGFEGSNVFALIEAKNELVNDVLVRQLYYPYRLWSGKTRKHVVPIFLSYSNDVFSFYVFRFGDLANYNSIELITRKRYQIIPNEIELQDLIDAMQRIQVQPEPVGVPFPQADSFPRIIDLLSQVHAAGTISQEDITTNHAFDVRQTQYYTNAGRYLGLIEISRSRDEGVKYSLTNRAAQIMARPPAARNLALAETILEHQVFNDTARDYLRQAGRPSFDEVITIMRQADLGLDREGTTTIPRRAQTVLAWVDWMMRLTRR
jgi:hypothetical protein